MIELVVQEADQCELVFSIVGLGEDVAVAATMCIDVVEDVHVSYLFQFDLCQ